MKILHILHTPRAEGTVRLVLDWLADRNCHQEVFVLNLQPDELAAELAARAAWFSAEPRLPGKFLKFPWMIWRVRRVCRQRRPDLVICWVNGFSPWVLCGARLGGVRSLITHAGNPPAWNFVGQLYTAFCASVTWFLGAQMVCCSRYVAAEFARSPGVARSVLRVVTNCAPVETIARRAAAVKGARKGDVFRLIMVGTLELHKDQSTLLRAMPLVLKSVPQVRLWLVGEGAQRVALQAQCESLGISGEVEFLGSRKDVPELLGSSDAFVFSTTTREGLGTVLIEALAAELPVIASDVPACREALEDGRWGVLVQPGDERALAAAIVKAVGRKDHTTPSERSEYLSRFSPASMMRNYIQMVTR